MNFIAENLEDDAINARTTIQEATLLFDNVEDQLRFTNPNERASRPGQLKWRSAVNKLRSRARAEDLEE